MRALLTPEFAKSQIINPLKDQFKLVLTGSLASIGGTSYNDIDIIMTYKNKDEIEQFKEALLNMGWTQDEDETYDNHYYNGEIWNNKFVTKKEDKESEIYDVRLEIYYQQDFGGERAIDDDRFKSA